MSNRPTDLPTQLNRCLPGSRLVAIERFVADPTAKARSDPNEICSRLNGNLYYRGQGPQPPLHYNCRCTREFFAYWCVIDDG